MRLVDLLQEWKKDSNIDLSKLDEDAVKVANASAKYQEILAATKKILYKHQIKLKKLKLQKRRYLLGKMTKEEMDELSWPYDPWRGESKPMKSEVDNYVDVADDVISLQEQYNEYDIMHDTLIDILNRLNWRHASVRNSIDYMKFVSGG